MLSAAEFCRWATSVLAALRRGLCSFHKASTFESPDSFPISSEFLGLNLFSEMRDKRFIRIPAGAERAVRVGTRTSRLRAGAIFENRGILKVSAKTYHFESRIIARSSRY